MAIARDPLVALLTLLRDSVDYLHGAAVHTLDGLRRRLCMSEAATRHELIIDLRRLAPRAAASPARRLDSVRLRQCTAALAATALPPRSLLAARARLEAVERALCKALDQAARELPAGEQARRIRRNAERLRGMHVLLHGHWHSGAPL